MAPIRRLRTDELTPAEIGEIRVLLWAAFADDEDGAFTEDDWQHSIGGVHFVASEGGAIVSHASVIERELHMDGKPLRTGYVEAVATTPESQGRGFASAVMREVGSYIAPRFELGALGTGRQSFYERFGWQIWRGPSFVRTPSGLLRTEEDDGYIMVIPTLSSPALDVMAQLSCEWRPGDVW